MGAFVLVTIAISLEKE